MPVFPSGEWMDAYCDELAAHPGALKAAEALDGVYRFVVTPDGPLTTEQSFDVAIALDDGEAQVRRLDGSGAKPRLTLTASYRRWRQLIRGQLDVAMAVMLRRLRVSGDFSVVRSRLGDAKPLTDALRAVPTTWLED